MKRYLRLYTKIFERKKDEDDFGNITEDGPGIKKKGYILCYDEYVFYKGKDNSKPYYTRPSERHLTNEEITKVDLTNDVSKLQSLEKLNLTELKRATILLYNLQKRLSILESIEDKNDKRNFLREFLDKLLDWFIQNKLSEPELILDKKNITNKYLFNWGGSRSGIEILFSGLSGSYLGSDIRFQDFASRFVINGNVIYSPTIGEKIDFDGQENELTYLIDILTRIPGKKGITTSRNKWTITAENFLAKGKPLDPKQLPKSVLEDESKKATFKNIKSTIIQEQEQPS
jgi:hypothetical protein